MSAFSIEELALAYRKAKVDLYYSTDQRRIDLATYEADLEENLTNLTERLNSRTKAWISDPDFLGGAYLTPKSVTQVPLGNATSMLWSDPDGSPQPDEASIPAREAEFRLMARCGIDFHIVSTIWITRIGHQFDAKLSASSMGNRLRRTADGSLNPASSGSFKPYLAPYRMWRESGLKAIEGMLERDQPVIALTADIESYYHRLEPDFLRDDDFLALFPDLRLSAPDRRLHRLFAESLALWQLNAAKELGFAVSGLPVGLPAAAVVANIALVELDRLIETQVRPIHYGRYVDDIILVIADGADITSPTALWEWIAARSNGQITVARTHDDPSLNSGAGYARFGPVYLAGSEVRFSNSKNKAFHLAGPTGRTTLAAIRRTVNERSSEYRSLPNLPQDARSIAPDLVSVLQADGDRADSLRAVDYITARKSGFALKLRDYEAIEMDLPASAWKAQRSALVDAVCDHVITLSNFFQLATYFPRLIKLTIGAHDLEGASRLLHALGGLIDRASASCVPTVKAMQVSPDREAVLWAYWRNQAAREAYEAIISAANWQIKPGEFDELDVALRSLGASRSRRLSESVVTRLHKSLFERDLAHVPFRLPYVADAFASHYGAKPPTPASGAGRLLPSNLRRGFRALARILGTGDGVPDGIAFATRPVQLVELYLCAQFGDAHVEFDASRSLIRDAMGAARGYEVDSALPQLIDDPFADGSAGPRPPARVIAMDYSPRDADSQVRCIGLGMLETAASSWGSAACGTPDLSLSRYLELSSLINQVINTQANVDYLLLPELSVPARWFLRFAIKLRAKQINLIAGIEYLHPSSETVSNQVWAALGVDADGFPGLVLYRQDKQVAAVHEARALSDAVGKRLEPEARHDAPPVIAHGDFRFAMLVCSELTNIASRAHFRGRIDALFVPEWNRDLNTFGALVESAALDIHSYVAQSNDRKYGDSRIRGPFSEDWQRDIVRVRGGIHNYVVAGTVDYGALRSHQSAKAPVDTGFKPCPDGFQISEARRVVPPATSW